MSPHTLVKRIIVRHFRGNQELKPIAVENNFDFNFQDFRRFSEKLIILPGDQITVECTYDTKKLNRPIFVSPQSVFYLGILIENFYFLRKKQGGLSTQEEMCMVFMLYYPRMKGIRTCLSGLTPETVMKLSNIYSVQRFVGFRIVEIKKQIPIYFKISVWMKTI